MPASPTARHLSAFSGRGAGTDAERRAATWLASQAAGPRREAHLETFWCRPRWALANAWHCAAAVGGSLLTVSHPLAGAIVVAIVLVSVLLDGLLGISIGRRLTGERASQNVVSEPRAPRDERIRLIVTANLDAGRTGLAQRLRGTTATLRRLPGGRLLPGWLGWLAIELLWLLIVAAIRGGGSGGVAVGILQFLPTGALVVELALLLDIATSPFGAAAGDNATGVAVALALVRALDAAPPQQLRVELCLQGSGEGTMIGLRHHLRARRGALRAADTVVLGIGAAGAGEPVWWDSDGPLVALGFHPRLRRLARQTAALPGSEPALAHAHRGRGTTPALPARLRGLPALSIGCLDARGCVPRSHTAQDQPEPVDSAAADRLLEFALTFVDALDVDLGRRLDGPGRHGATRAAA
jgi:hypothetical protein